VGRWIVLALIGLVLAEVLPSAEAKMRLNLVRAGACGDVCPIDTLRHGVVEVSGTRKRDAKGLVGRIRIRGARKLGEQVDVQNLVMILPLAEEDGICIANVVEGIAIEKGNASFAFTGADVPLAARSLPGATLALCGEVRFQRADAQGYDPILTAGLVLGVRRKESQSRGRLRMDLVRPPGCGVDCPIDSAGRATVEFFNASADEGGGLAAKVDIRGARKAGRKIDLPALRLDVGFRPGDVRICWAASVFGVAIAGGRTARKAVRQDVITAMPRDAGTIVSPCADVQLDRDDEGEEPVLVGGIVLGAGRGSRSPNDVHSP
jgi:hypothetical protein